jgi:hypothetical protein
MNMKPAASTSRPGEATATAVASTLLWLCTCALVLWRAYGPVWPSGAWRGDTAVFMFVAAVFLGSVFKIRDASRWIVLIMASAVLMFGTSLGR